MNIAEDFEAMGARMLARKGTLCLVKLDGGLYAVDRITKSCSYSVLVGDRDEAIDKFAELCAGQRKGRHDFNLDVFARLA